MFSISRIGPGAVDFKVDERNESKVECSRGRNMTDCMTALKKGSISAACAVGVLRPKVTASGPLIVIQLMVRD